MTNYKGINARTIAAMLAADPKDGALVMYVDGSFDVLPSLAAEPIDNTDTRLLRHPAREVARDLIRAAEDQAQHEKTSTRLSTLQAAAARELRAELAAEDARMEMVTTPRIPAQGAVLTPETLHDFVVLHPGEMWAWEALIEALEPLLLP